MQKLPASDGLYETRNHYCGVQYLYRFNNGYGASVVYDAVGGLHFEGHADKYELAVIVWNDGEFKLTYDTPVSSDVEAWLDTPDVDKLLAQIAVLPAPNAG